MGYKRALNITPDDEDVYVPNLQRFYIGGTGDLTLVLAGGQTVIYESLPDGSWVVIQTKQVLETGTTATKITAEY